MLQKDIEDRQVIEEWLSGRRGQKVHIRVPVKGTKEKLVELALENARMVLAKDRERIKREEGRTIGAVKEVENWLNLKDLVRMEAYDISNISGFESVGSMVVYEKGRPKRSDYRKFKIKWVQGPNDYASMEEVLTRRFTHESKERIWTAGFQTSGSDSDGRWKRTGKYRFEGVGKSGNGYSGMWYGKR